MKIDFTNPSTVAAAVIEGHALTAAEASTLIDAPLEELRRGANALRRKFRGDHANLCSIINARSGKCTEDCRYCAQSSHYSTGCAVHGLVSAEETLALAKANEAAGAHRFSLVTSGRELSDADFEGVIALVKLLRAETKLTVCASLGLLTSRRADALADAGLSLYHHNLETSREFFPKICTTHTFEDRVQTIRKAQAAGLRVCSGGIFGLGETRADRISMAFSLRDLGVVSVPLNILDPIPGTPFEKNPPLPPDEILRAIALYRFILPNVSIRFAGGRAALGPDGIDKALAGGVDSAITGDMLTTTGAKIRADIDRFTRLGFACDEA